MDRDSLGSGGAQTRPRVSDPSAPLTGHLADLRIVRILVHPAGCGRLEL